MEELIELFEGKLCVDCFTFITLVQKVHLQVNETFSILLDQRIGGSDRKFKVEVDKLRVVNFLQELSSCR